MVIQAGMYICLTCVGLTMGQLLSRPMKMIMLFQPSVQPVDKDFQSTMTNSASK